MTNLIGLEQKITDFLETSIKKFQDENKTPNSIGIYCCPRAGWLTSNFNLTKTISDTDSNCPDFEFVEYDSFELTELSEEYESENPTLVINGIEKKIDIEELGDEGYNKEIFEFLKPIGQKISTEYEFEVLIQMLDSEYIYKIK